MQAVSGGERALGGCLARQCEQQSLSVGAEKTASAAEPLSQALPGWIRQESSPIRVPLKEVGEQATVLALVSTGSFPGAAGGEEAAAAAAAAVGCELRRNTESATGNARASAPAVAPRLRLRAAPLG